MSIVKQLSLNDFAGKVSYHSSTGGLPPTVLFLLSQGFSIREIGRRIGRSHVSVLNLLKKLREKGLVSRNDGHKHGVWRLVTAQGLGMPFGSSGLGYGGLVAQNARIPRESGLVEAHHVKARAFVRRKGSLEAVARVCSGSVGNWVFKRAGVTLVLHRRVLSVSVASVPGETLKEVQARSEMVVLPTLRLFERETGFRFRNLEWRGDFHWAFNKRVSRPLLEVMPGLADGSHPEQVELHDLRQVEAVKELINGSLRASFTSLIQEQQRRIEALELVVREQAVVLTQVRDLFKLLQKEF